MVAIFNEALAALRKEHPQATIHRMIWAKASEIVAKGHTCIFVSSFLGHFDDDEVVALLKLMISWLNPWPVETTIAP